MIILLYYILMPKHLKLIVTLQNNVCLSVQEVQVYKNRVDKIDLVLKIYIPIHISFTLKIISIKFLFFLLKLP